MRPDENILPQHARVGAVPAGPFSASAITFRSPEESMAEALAIPASAGRGGIGRAHSGRADHAGRSSSRERLRSGRALTASESRRAGNRERIGLGSELRCECTRPNCRDMVPAVAETQRGISQRFVVTPAHFEGGVVVRAADRFFVVEPGGYAFVQSQGSVK